MKTTLSTAVLLGALTAGQPFGARAQTPAGIEPNTLATPKPAPPLTAPGVPLQNNSSASRTSRSREPVPPVLVQFTGTNGASVGSMEEDLIIMGHLLDQAFERALGEDVPPRKSGIQLTYTSSARAVRALYLEGFGVLFMAKVNIPVAAASTVEEAAASKPGESEWQEARRNVIGNDETTVRVWDVAGGGSGPDFDSDQVEGLKKELIRTLKNGTNIRQLKPNEYIGISVFGSGLPVIKVAPSGRTGSSTKKDKDKDKATDLVGAASATAAFKVVDGDGVALKKYATALSAQKGTTLTLRVKKSDVDAFAEGRLSLDAFAQKVVSNAYFGNGYGLVSINSWIQGNSTTRR